MANAAVLTRRKLGASELEITTVGLGAWAIGGAGSYVLGPEDAARIEGFA